MSDIPVSQARAQLPALLDRVSAGEEVTLTRHGQSVAVLVRPDSLRSRRADAVFAGAERILERLAHGRTAPLAVASGLTAKRAEALVAEIRADRDAE